jgi:hypothetical protein
MRKLIALFIVLTCCLAFSSAQQKKATDLSKWDVFGGYSYSRGYFANMPFSPMSLNGGQGAATYYFNKNLGATGEFAGYSDDVEGLTVRTQGYLFGPTGRFGVKNQRVSFFAQQLFGVTHFSFTADPILECTSDCTSTTNAFTMISGGGVDIKVKKYLSLRPMQLEYFSQRLSIDNIGIFAASRPGPVAYGRASSGMYLSTNGFRYSTGAVFHF